MKDIRINKIHSIKMFDGLMMGGPKPGMYEKELDKMMLLLGDEYPIINLSEVTYTQLVKSSKSVFNYGSWGHITGVGIDIDEDGDIYSFCVIFNYEPKKEILQEKINEVISKIDYKTSALKWDMGDY